MHLKMDKVIESQPEDRSQKSKANNQLNTDNNNAKPKREKGNKKLLSNEDHTKQQKMKRVQNKEGTNGKASSITSCFAACFGYCWRSYLHCMVDFCENSNPSYYSYYSDDTFCKCRVDKCNDDFKMILPEARFDNQNTPNIDEHNIDVDKDHRRDGKSGETSDKNSQNDDKDVQSDEQSSDEECEKNEDYIKETDEDSDEEYDLSGSVDREALQHVARAVKYIPKVMKFYNYFNS